jgi:DNA-binding transcriptional LysR family regulator
MEMNQVRYFLAVCEHHNFTHAAGASNVSQPSLTTSIKKLEEELGGELFVRDRAGCRLTPLGKLMYPRLHRVSVETRGAKAEAVRHARLESVPIRLGVGETIGHNIISKGLERFQSIFPQVEVELIVETIEELFAGLRRNEFDAVVTAENVNPDLYHTDPLYLEEYQVVVAHGHSLAKSKTVSVAELANTRLLDRPNCELRDAFHATCAQHGHTLYATYSSNRLDWLIDLTKRGLGAVILPSTAIPIDCKLVALSIIDVNITRQVTASRYRHQTSRPETNKLIREITRGG